MNPFADRRARRALGLTALLAAACGTGDGAGDRSAPADTPAAATRADSGGMAGMPGMSGMAAPAGESARMIGEMTASLRSLDGASGDSLRRALPRHRQRLANMIAEMNREMRDMRMDADAAWSATVDSLRQDLTRMPELGAGELAAAMPAHRARVERLMQSHRQMMGAPHR
jgi:hypothetical protein